MNENKPAKNSDMLVAVGAIMCIALGASMTYWLTHGANQKAVAMQEVPEGRAIDAPKLAPTTTVGAAQPPSAKEQATAAAAAAKTSDGDYLPLTFSTLSSYYYELPGIEAPIVKTAKEQIPAPIKALNEKRIALQGFMVPTDLRDGKCTTFLLVKDQSLCCFGRMPRMNEWVDVKTHKGKSARAILDQPITIFGTLSVGEAKDKNGEIMSIYRVDADDVAGPLDL